ncbi:MAG TPA: phosphatase PAP2 family protein [Gaiellaceae bacterium]|nr:phosphatase PAP2 family protein [Gaiellaceae bacterium]
MKPVCAPPEAGRRKGLLPRGRGDLVRQTLIWLGFGAAYEIARGLADRGTPLALENARRILDAELALHGVVEPWLQRQVLAAGGLLLHAVNYTYWLSQFVVVGLVLLWIYLRRYPAFLRVRDTVIVTNTIALVGYVLLPTAPPRLLPGQGFVDTVAASPISHATDLVELASNPYAAMPSLHAADALIVGVSLALLVRPLWLKVLWLLWPCWVAFALMASANHFWLDIAVGVALAAIAVPVTGWIERRRARVSHVEHDAAAPPPAFRPERQAAERHRLDEVTRVAGAALDGRPQPALSHLERRDPLGDEALDLGEEDELVQPVDQEERGVVRGELDQARDRLAGRA